MATDKNSKSPLSDRGGSEGFHSKGSVSTGQNDKRGDPRPNPDRWNDSPQNPASGDPLGGWDREGGA